MELFVGPLPRYAAVSHLTHFFAGYGRVAHFRVLEKVADSGEIVNFGHGVVEPDVAACRAIERLDGRRLLGVPVHVREYVHRRAGDRRRVIEWRSQGELRMGGDRRQPGRFRPAPASWR